MNYKRYALYCGMTSTVIGGMIGAGFLILCIIVGICAVGGIILASMVFTGIWVGLTVYFLVSTCLFLICFASYTLWIGISCLIFALFLTITIITISQIAIYGTILSCLSVTYIISHPYSSVSLLLAIIQKV